MKVGLARYKALVSEIDNVRMRKVNMLFKYNTIIDKHPNYRDRRVEAKVASYTRKIRTLEEIKIRYESE